MSRIDTLADESPPPGEYYCPTCEKSFATAGPCPNDGTRLVRIAAAIDPFIGRELDGRYTIVEKLGQGGMGAVYRAEQHGLGREVAVKLVNATLTSEPAVIKRFLREAKLASRLTHPNAVAVLDFGQTSDGLFYLVMELVQGRTLDQVIKKEGKFPPERLVRIGMQVCDALEGAHALQIIHRDLKPSNIMVLDRGRDLVKVLDFGLAKSVAPDQTGTTMTNAGALVGTPQFIPPELALGEACDGRADLYSLGCILYVLGSGRLPFQGETAHALIAMHATEPAPPMTGVPQPLADVIDRLLQKDPALRLQSAAATREALELALPPRDTPLPGRMAVAMSQSIAYAGKADTVPLPVPEVKRRRWWLVPVAVALVAGGGIAAYQVTSRSSTGGAASAPAGPSPSPTPSPSPSPNPTPIPSPSPTPSPNPTPSPDPTPTANSAPKANPDTNAGATTTESVTSPEAGSAKAEPAKRPGKKRRTPEKSGAKAGSGSGSDGLPF